jgi:hypothetical protein
MMGTKGRLATILIALTFFGCKGPVQTSAASASDGSSGGASSGSSGDGAGSASSSSGGTRVEYIKDETLNNMDAIPVRFPANWKFQGVLFQPGNCVDRTYAVWRATSPDGKTFAERMPMLGWTYGTGPMLGFTPKDGCLPMKGAMSAQDFAKHMAGTLHVQAVEVKPFPDAAKAALEQDAQQRHETAQGALATVQFTNGSTPMKGMLKVMVRCSESVTAAPRGLAPYAAGQPVHTITTGSASTVDHCEANVVYIASPESQFAGLLQQWSAPGMGNAMGTDAWQEAWTQRSMANTRERTRGFINASNDGFNAQQEGYRRQAAVQQQMHSEFMDTMQRGTDISRANAQASTNARTTAASDWVDYALDQKTVMNTNNGQLYKMSNQSTPMGPEVQVHGNGTP